MRRPVHRTIVKEETVLDPLLERFRNMTHPDLTVGLSCGGRYG